MFVKVNLIYNHEITVLGSILLFLPLFNFPINLAVCTRNNNILSIKLESLLTELRYLCPFVLDLLSAPPPSPKSDLGATNSTYTNHPLLLFP